MARQRRQQPGSIPFGQYIITLRKQYAQTQEGVAGAMKINTGTLRAIEQGKVLAAWPEDVENLCTALALPQSDVERVVKLYQSSMTRKVVAAVPLSRRPLSFAGQETEFVIIDGVGDAAVPPENITLEIDWDTAEIPSRLQQFYDRYVRAVDRRQHEHDLQTPYDGEIFSIKAISVSRIPGEELPRWSIFLKKNTYYQYAALARNLDDEYDDAGRNTTMRRAYFQHESFDPRRPPEFMNNFGISMAVYLKKDKRLVFVKKGTTEIYPRALGAAVAECILSAKKSAKGDVANSHESGNALVNCAIRGADEELGLTITPEMITFLSLGFNRHAAEYSVIGLISVDVSWQELQQTVLMARDARFEISQLYSIPAHPMPRALRDLFDQTKQAETFWSPMAFGTLLIALRFFNPTTYTRYDQILTETPKQFGALPPYNCLVPYYQPLISR